MLYYVSVVVSLNFRRKSLTDELIVQVVWLDLRVDSYLECSFQAP